MLRSACTALLRPQVTFTFGTFFRIDGLKSSSATGGFAKYNAGRRCMSILPRQERKLIKLSGEDFHGKEVHKWRPLYCRYGVAALDHGYIKGPCIEAIKKVLKRRLKPERLIIRVQMNQPVTKKPIGKRMGGGKSKVVYHQCWVRRGRIILEFDTDKEVKAIEAARGIDQRLSMRSVFIRKPKTAQEIEFERLMSKGV